MDPMITSGQNPRVKKVRRLRNRREREQSDLFLIEGYRELLRAAEAKRFVLELFICPELFLGANEQPLIDQIAAAGATILPCNEKVFRQISYRDRPDGLLAIAKQKHFLLEDLKLTTHHSPLKLKSSPFFVVAEAIEKPGNLGTILRSSDAVNVDGVIVCDRCTDIHNPNVVRASVGTLFTVPIVEASGEETMTWLHDHQIAIVAATPSATCEFTDADLSGPVAIAVGTEQLGLSQRWMEDADIQVKIPMCGIADSLNVATATTLLLYEVLRQRRQR